MPSCSPEMIDKHVETIHTMDKRIDKLITLQEITTKNINKLTEDINQTMCEKTSCDAVNKRVIILEDKCKEMWFFLFASRHPKMVALMAIGGLVILFSAEIKLLLGL